MKQFAGLSGGEVAGIVIGVILGVLVLAVIIFLGLSYMGVVNGPIAPRQTTPSSSSDNGSKGFTSGFTNTLFNNSDHDGGGILSGEESVGYQADA